MSKVSSEYITPENFGDYFLQGEPERIYNQCIKDFQKIVTLNQFKELVHSFNQNVDYYQLTQITSLGTFTQYLWLDKCREKSICVVFDSFNRINRLLIKPFITFPKSDDRYTQNIYSMPVQDEWTVFWGGKNEFVNYHYVYESQRYAYDLVVMKDNMTYKDNKICNENYYAFNKEVMAPANGKVVKVINHISDNIPGEMNEAQPAGNYVVIQHANKEYSLIAHFKQNSIVVHEGEELKQGQLIGLCGNSGNSSEAHIHFQVMDNPELSKCKSICIRFNDGIEPVQGDLASPSYPTDPDDKKLDNVDKVEIALSLTDVLLFLPRLIGHLFK